MDLFTRFQRTLSRLDIREGACLVVGVSGGADSLALLHLLTRSREALKLELHAVHVNHQIRGQEAFDDEQAVESLARQWEVPLRVERVDVPGLAAERRLTLEEAARKARYTALARAAAEARASMILVAHNADDQAETVLLHLLRGSGLAGLRGMEPRTRLSPQHLLDADLLQDAALIPPLHLIRPLLETSRAEIDAYCAEQGLVPRLDSTNLDTTYTRNRLRHAIMPLLEQINPSVRAALGRTASMLQADYLIVEQETQRTFMLLAQTAAHQVRLDLREWRELPVSLRRGTLRLAVQHLRSDLRNIGFEHIESAVQIAHTGPTGAQATLPAGLVLYVDYDALVVTERFHPPAPPDWPLLEPGSHIMISSPGGYVLPESSWQFQFTVYEGPREGPAWGALLADPWCAVLDADVFALPAALRARLPGDTFYPQGAGGSQKVSDFMTNAKIPSPLRRLLPLLTSDAAIGWVCGFRVDERFIVRPATRRIWLARFEKLSNVGIAY